MSRLKNYDLLQDYEVPGVTTIFDNNMNPTIYSPYSEYSISFYQTKDTMQNPEIYRVFLNNAMKRFRGSRRYTNYKGFLISLGLDRCQYHGNITSDMADIEMHHNMLTLMDISLIITEHVLNTIGKISTFDLCTLLKKEHSLNRVQVLMLSLTPHQIYHNTKEFFIPSAHCVGDWWSFLETYNKGITYEVAKKIIYNMEKTIQHDNTMDAGEMLVLRDKILEWSDLNEHCNRDIKQLY